MERMLITIANKLTDWYEISIITAFNESEKPFFPISDKVQQYDLRLVQHDYSSGSSRKKAYRERLEAYLFAHHQDVCISLGSLEYTFLTKLKDGSKKVLWFHFALNYDIMTCRVSRFGAVNRLVGTLKTYRRLWLARKYDHVVCLSKEDLKRWRKHLSNVSQIYNPITITKTMEPDYSAKRVIAVGRLDSQKGFDLLISAWKHVQEHFPDWSLDIYGEGDLREPLQRQIDGLGLGGCVALRGRTADMPEELARHSIMVLSSRFEGFGLVLCEASVCAIPQVSYCCESGPSEIIEDHKSGILVKQVGDIHGLALALGELMTSEDMRRRMGQCAERLSHRFDLPEVVGRWRELLDKLALQN